LRIYFDVCALGRLTDNQTQERIRTEAEAVQAALRLVRLGVHQWVTSPAVLDEVIQNSDPERRRDAMDLLRYADLSQELTAEVVAMAMRFRQAGLGSYDALHLAAAIEAGCDALLTTDDRFIRAASRLDSPHSKLVRNPLEL